MRSGVVLRGVVVSLLVLLGVTGAACGGSGSSSGGDAVTGSAGKATKKYDSTGFTAVHAAQGASVVVQQGDTFAVSVTVNENLVQYLTVEVQGDTLQIGLDPSQKYRLADLSAEVTMPDLSGIDVTEAADVLAKGFMSKGDLTLKVSGAGQLSMEGMKAADATLEVSGASRLGGRLVLTGGADHDGIRRRQGHHQRREPHRGPDGHRRQPGLAQGLRRADGDRPSDRRLQRQRARHQDGQCDARRGLGADYYGPAKLGNTDVNGASQVNHMR